MLGLLGLLLRERRVGRQAGFASGSGYGNASIAITFVWNYSGCFFGGSCAARPMLWMVWTFDGLGAACKESVVKRGFSTTGLELERTAFSLVFMLPTYARSFDHPGARPSEIFVSLLRCPLWVEEGFPRLLLLLPLNLGPGVILLVRTGRYGRGRFGLTNRAARGSG